MNKTYVAIDLKSFYASVECVERGLDPLTTNLVVADISRTEKTICLAVSPSLKAYGIPGRARLFEVIQAVKRVNAERLRHAPGHRFTGKAVAVGELAANPSLELDFIIAKPQMAHYIERSTQIYSIYMRHVSPDDICVYSVDEVFIDATPYLPALGITGREFAQRLIRDVLVNTGITATVGIGTNLYLSKVAMDIWAKRITPDESGARIAELDERKYREYLWAHTPLTDFWRVGPGYQRRLHERGLYTMGDIARCSVINEESLYRTFGKNAELLIDHAWGWEPCDMRSIKAYKPENSSLSLGQVLQEPYPFDKARVIVREMADSIAMELFEKRLRCSQVALNVVYESGEYADREGVIDRYGRKMPKPAHGIRNFDAPTGSRTRIIDAATAIYDEKVDKALSIRRIYIALNQVLPVGEIAPAPEQLSMFDDPEQHASEAEAQQREENLQDALVRIANRYGRNAVLPGTSYQEGATRRQRNRQIGGHQA